METLREELSFAGGGWSFIPFDRFCPPACSNYPSHLSLAYKEICDSAVTVLWLSASCPAVYLLPPHSSYYQFSRLPCLLFLQWLELLPWKWETHGHVTPQPWEYLNSINEGLWDEGSLLAETGESFRGSTLQRKGWHVCGWSPKACHRRRKPVPWWIHSLFQPLQGDWYSLQGVHSTTKRHFTYRIFFPF